MGSDKRHGKNLAKYSCLSGRTDLNRRSPDPQSGALTKLGHVPLVLSDRQMLAHPGHAWRRGTGVRPGPRKRFRSRRQYLVGSELVVGAARSGQKVLTRGLRRDAG
jgi:hypothetical protein